MDEVRMRNIFRRNLNRLFTESGRQKKELAAFVGVNDNTVTSWVTGRKVPRMDKIDRICAFFQAQRKDLILPPGPREEPPPVLTAAERELLRQYRALDERGRDAVVTLLEHEYDVCAGSGKTPEPRPANRI